MHNKYRLFLQTTRGGYFVAASETVNNLVELVRQWLTGTSVGRSVYDDQVRELMLYEYDPKHGDFKRIERLPVTSIDDVIRKTRELGGR